MLVHEGVDDYSLPVEGKTRKDRNRERAEDGHQLLEKQEVRYKIKGKYQALASAGLTCSAGWVSVNK